METPEMIKLPYLISDGMVLQRDQEVCIWGQVVSGARICLRFLGNNYETVPDDLGNWEICLNKLPAGGPHEMIIRCEGYEKRLKDIWVGDVYVLGGQSNMQITVTRTLDLFEEEVKDANIPAIREFVVPMVYDFHGPINELSGGSWDYANPASIYSFSAIGYFFAKALHDKYNIPVGLIQTALGGTPAEAWISEKTLMRFGRFQELLTMCKDDAYVNGTKQREEMRNNRWYHELYESDEGLHDQKASWYSEGIDDSFWGEILLPASFEDTELEAVRGTLWFRKEIMVPEHMAVGKAKLILGTIVDEDDTYLNGVMIGNTGYKYPPRRYTIPEGLLKPGKNILAVRAIMTENTGAFITDMPYLIKTQSGEIPLSGTWKYRIGAMTRPLAPTTSFQYRPTGVYNGMIYPLRKYAIRGVLWYQGESNTGYPYDYKDLFEGVIKDWRDNWNRVLPFLYVQIANYCPWKQEPEVSGLARVREEQRKAMEVPNTGMAVTIDVGQYNDLHPWDKKSVGNRLALWAYKLIYGEDVICSGPIFDFMEVKGETIRLHFKYTGSGLVVKGDTLEGFDLSGADGVFRPACAVIMGDTVMVSSQSVKEPANVRYAWADNPDKANLYNREGLPASPFSSK